MQVKIFKQQKSPQQSGNKKNKWVIEFKEKQNSRFAEHLMGRISSNDMNQEVTLFFDSLEKAKLFAQENNLIYEIISPKKTKLKKKSYADNFTIIPIK